MSYRGQFSNCKQCAWLNDRMVCSTRTQHVAWFGTHTPERFIRLAIGQCVFDAHDVRTVQRGKTWSPITWWLFSGLIQSCELFSNSVCQKFKTNVLEWAKTPPFHHGACTTKLNSFWFVAYCCLSCVSALLHKYRLSRLTLRWRAVFQDVQFLEIARRKEN